MAQSAEDRKKKKFLVPVDFSKQSLIALEQTYNLARLYNAEIVLVFVRDRSAFTKLFAKDRNEEEMIAVLESRLEKLALRTKEDQSLDITYRIMFGKVYEQIIKAAEEEDVNLIIMGTHGGEALERKFIGSNAIRVVKSAPCPVITVKGESHRDGCKKIVLPLDMHKETTQKIKEAVELARLFDGAQINVIGVNYYSEKEKELKAVPLLESVGESIENQGITCKVQLVKIIRGEDSLASGIIGYAEWVDADLIMIMTQQEFEPTSFFIGSTAQSIINESDIPVMSIVPRYLARKQ